MASSAHLRLPLSFASGMTAVSSSNSSNSTTQAAVSMVAE